MKHSTKLFVSIYLFISLAGILLRTTSEAAAPPEQTKQVEKISLRLNLEKGKTYKMKVTAVQKINQEVMNNKMEIDQTIGIGTEFKVTDVSNKGIYTISIKYSSVLFKQSGGPMGSIEYNSEKPPENIPLLAKGFAALTGLTLGVKMDSLGEVKDVTGLKEFMDKLIEKIAVPDGPQKEQITKALKSQFGEKAMKKMMRDITCVYPEKALAINDSWSESAALSGPMPLIMDSTWTLKKHEKGLVTLAVKSKLEANKDPEVKPLTVGNMKQKIELSGTQEGTTTVDKKTGWTKTSRITQDLSGKIIMTGQYSMTIPMKIKSETTLIGE